MYLHRMLLLLIPAVYLVLPLAIDWLQSLHGPWYQPFLIWAALVLVALVAELRRRHA